MYLQKPDYNKITRIHSTQQLSLVSVWLKADLDVLMKRVGKRPTRPLLKADNPRAIMEKLMAERNPVYAEADIALETGEGPHEEVVDRLVTLLEPYK